MPALLARTTAPQRAQPLLALLRRAVGIFLAWLVLLTVSAAPARTLEGIVGSKVLRICVAGSSAAFYQANGEAFAAFLKVQPEVLVLKAWDEQFQNAQGQVVQEASYVPKLLDEGRCDIYPNDLHVSDWRLSKMDLVPYYTSRKVLVSHRDVRTSVLTLDDLQGRSAAVQKGTAYDTWLMAQNSGRFAANPVRITYLPTAQSMKAVAARQADFTVVGAESSFKWVRGDLDSLDILFPVDEPVAVAWGIHPQADDLRAQLEQFFQDNRRVGSALDRSWRKQYDISLMEYQLFEASFASDTLAVKDILLWVLPVVGVFGGVLFVFSAWNRRLRLEMGRREQAEAKSKHILERKSELAALAMQMHEVASTQELAQLFLSHARTALGALQGVIYLYTDDADGRLQQAGASACSGAVPEQLLPGEGLLGQCALDQRLQVLDTAEPGFWRIRSGLGNTQPLALLIAPIALPGKPLGVVELALLSHPDAQAVEKFEEMASLLAMNLEILRRNRRGPVVAPDSGGLEMPA